MTARILIIEDDKDMATVLGMRLTKAGFEVRSAPDAIMGLKHTHDFKPNLIILDLGLPAGGGFAVLERVKLSTHTNQIPIFILTGSADDQAKEKALAKGAHHFIQKPYEFDSLLAEINKLLEVKS
jgi:DNA-binding response OmpR family regulator